MKPENCQGNIIYLTDGPTNQKSSADRKTLLRDSEYLIEDVLDPSGEVSRRLIFVKSYQRIQAQVVLDFEAGELDYESE